MGLFSDIQEAARREARQAREQEEQAALQQDTQPQPIPTPVSEHLEAQPEQTLPPPVSNPEPQKETAQQEQAVPPAAPEPEVPTPTPELEPLKQPTPAVKQMSDSEAVAASTKRIQTEIENITRKNMKEYVAEHLAELCAKDPSFAHKVIQPGKTMVDCFSYINQKAQKFAEQERKDNGITESGIYGCAIPTDLVFGWAVDYFKAPVEKKPERKAPTKAATPAKTNHTPAKPADKPEEPAQPKAPPTPASECYEQMRLM